MDVGRVAELYKRGHAAVANMGFVALRPPALTLASVATTTKQLFIRRGAVMPPTHPCVQHTLVIRWPSLVARTLASSDITWESFIDPSIMVLVIVGWVLFRQSRCYPCALLRESVGMYYNVLACSAAVAYALIGSSAAMNYSQFVCSVILGCACLICIISVA